MTIAAPKFFKIIVCDCNDLSSISWCVMTKLELISHNCNFNYSTQSASELKLQEFMLGLCVLPFRATGPKTQNN